MPRALVREQQHTMLTRAQTAMIGLIAVTCTSSVQPVYPAPTSKRLQTWDNHYSRDDGLEDIVDYALVHQGLERERTKKYKANIEKKIVRADDFDPGLFQVKFRFQQAEFSPVVRRRHLQVVGPHLVVGLLLANLEPDIAPRSG